jgi:hypothetical protein
MFAIHYSCSCTEPGSQVQMNFPLPYTYEGLDFRIFRVEVPFIFPLFLHFESHIRGFPILSLPHSIYNIENRRSIYIYENVNFLKDEKDILFLGHELLPVGSALM